MIDTIDLSQEAEVAIKAAIEAGKVTLAKYNEGFTVSEKDDKSPVTEADIASNKIIEATLAESPHIILSEESRDNKERLQSKKVWIIDPLDGTADFIRKKGDFSVMIALVQEGEPILGVIYHPVKDLLYVAEKGKGSYVKTESGWSKLSVNEKSELSNLKMVVSRNHLSDEEKSFREILKIQNWYDMGSCGLKVMEICNSDAELYFTTTNKIKEWDTCAAYCILKEAGGDMTDMRGQALTYNNDDVHHQHGILVTNGKVHKTIVDEFDKFKKDN